LFSKDNIKEKVKEDFMKVLANILTLGSLLIAVSASAFAVETPTTCPMISSRRVSGTPLVVPASEAPQGGSKAAPANSAPAHSVPVTNGG
jgi:hypothetical protein